MRQIDEKKALCRMASYCSKAEHCAQDVKKKLLLLGLNEKQIQNIIDYLIKEKYVDDSRYAASFVNDKLRFNKWGCIKIRFELKRKEISEDIIQEVINNVDELSYLEQLQELLRSKKKGIKYNDKRDLQTKLFRFAANRGYESDLITRSLKQIMDETEDTYLME